MIREYSHMIPGIQYNVSELTVVYPNGSKLTLYGADNPDSLRGIALWGVGFDEYSQQPSNIFTEIIAPALADHNGYAIWIGTPKGKNEFYKLSEKAKNTPNWQRWIIKASESGVLGTEELKIQRSMMSLDEYNQEFECSFEAAIKGAYYASQLEQARNEGRITAVPYELMVPVHTWWDLGIGDSTAIGFFQQVNNQWRVIDYYEASGEGLAHYIKILREKNYIYEEHWAPHDIQVRELGTGKSRIEMAKELGLEFKITPKLSIEDGINALRSRFNTLWFDEIKCSRLLDALSLYRKEWNDKMGSFKDDPVHDWTSHAADMLRYWAVSKLQTRDAQFEAHILRNRQRSRTMQ